MHRYDSIKKLSRSGRVNNIFGSVIPNIAHIAFSPNKTWDMRICTVEFASQSGFLNAVCDLLFSLQSAPPVVKDASYTKPTRHPSARFESRCMFKRKSPHFCSDETLTFHKKGFWDVHKYHTVDLFESVLAGVKEGGCDQWWDAKWRLQLQGALLFQYHDVINDTLGHMAQRETGILVEYSLALAL